jgi:hypothetical protein
MSMRVKRPALSGGEVRDHRLCAVGIGATTGPIAWPRPKRRSMPKPRASPS